MLDSERRQWQRERMLIEAQAQATIAELRADLVELRSDFVSLGRDSSAANAVDHGGWDSGGTIVKPGAGSRLSSRATQGVFQVGDHSP